METSPTLLDRLTTDLLVLWLHTAVAIITFSLERVAEPVGVEGGVGQLPLVKVQSVIV